MNPPPTTGTPAPATASGAGRRQPPPRRRVEVRRVEPLTAHLVRVTFGGPDLAGWPVGDPTGHCKVFLPSAGEPEPVLPEWGPDGPVFPAGQPRPIVRTYTPRRFDPDALELDVDFVIHDGGPASAWAAQAAVGQRAAVAGTGRGYAIDPAAKVFHLAGDETAIPAIGVLLEHLDPAATVAVTIEISAPDAELALPGHPGAIIRWLLRRTGAEPGAELIDALAHTALPDDVRVWVAAEATAVRTIRRGLIARGLPVDRLVTRGYWKRGESDHPDGDYAQDA